MLEKPWDASVKAIVIRHGAFGDAIMASCVLPYLDNDGYEITFYTNEKGAMVLKNNPRISEFVMHNSDIPIGEELDAEWEKQSEGYDKVVNLTGSMENELLFAYHQPLYSKTLRERREYVNGRNYFDYHLEKAGYTPNGNSVLPEIYFSKAERNKAKSLRNKHKGMFIITWALTGSAIHKIYRYFEQTMTTFLSKHKDAMLVTVGDHTSKLLTFQHPRCINTMLWEMPFREAMLLAGSSDLVVGPETGILIASSAFDVPKICLRTHSGADQLTKHWINDYSIQAPVSCSPCHLLHKYKDVWRDKCQLDDDKDFPMPACTNHKQEDVLNKMEEVYALTKEGRYQKQKN